MQNAVYLKGPILTISPFVSGRLSLTFLKVPLQKILMLKGVSARQNTVLVKNLWPVFSKVLTQGTEKYGKIGQSSEYQIG